MADIDPAFTLAPADDPPTSPDDDLAAAAAAATGDAKSQVPVAPDVLAPMGRTWQFDWERGQFITAGQGPAETTGVGAIAQWCLMAVHSARYAHQVFSDDFGMEEPDGVIGQFGTGEAVADWQRNLVDAFLVHDRITSIDNFVVSWEARTGILSIESFDVTTDQDQTFTVVAGTTIQGGENA